jgi:hypothetical protein
MFQPSFLLVVWKNAIKCGFHRGQGQTGRGLRRKNKKGAKLPQKPSHDSLAK